MKEIYDEAMALSSSERASLAHNLILSLDDPSDFDLGPPQENEISRRVQLIHEGRAEGRPSAGVLTEIKSHYTK
jgi:putative addiction module component (TIGR02574 family)